VQIPIASIVSQGCPQKYVILDFGVYEFLTDIFSNDVNHIDDLQIQESIIQIYIIIDDVCYIFCHLSHEHIYCWISGYSQYHFHTIIKKFPYTLHSENPESFHRLNEMIAVPALCTHTSDGTHKNPEAFSFLPVFILSSRSVRHPHHSRCDPFPPSVADVLQMIPRPEH
jgi:hypothetical protein